MKIYIAAYFLGISRFGGLWGLDRKKAGHKEQGSARRSFADANDAHLSRIKRGEDGAPGAWWRPDGEPETDEMRIWAVV